MTKTLDVAHYHPHHLAYVPTKFEVAMSNSLRDEFTRNVSQYPPYHVTYVPAKFEVAMSKVKEDMHLQKNTLLDLGLKVTQYAI